MKNTMDIIGEYIEKIQIGCPIFTSDIQKYVQSQMENTKPLVINEYINRYEKKHSNFVRYKKGIYYKCADTIFGETKIKYSDLIKRLYIENDEDVYGYETGPSFINNLGLTTQMPKCVFIATNRLQVDKINENIKLVKPVTKISKKNCRYLQILDVISNRFKVNIEASNYNDIIRKEIDKMNLNFEQLLYYATFYNDNGIYKKIAELAKRGE